MLMKNKFRCVYGADFLLAITIYPLMCFNHID